MAKARNYSTVLFAAYPTEYDGAWESLNGLFSQFDHVVSKSTLNLPVANDMGMDDRVLTHMVVDYLEKQGHQDKNFFMVIIWNNLHIPFLVTEDYVDPPNASNEEIEAARYLNSLSITDKNLKTVMNKLKEKDLLDDTLVVFSSDHGESPSVGKPRVYAPNVRVIGSPLWFRIPQGMLSPKEKEILAYNTKYGTVSNLDIVPTVADILGWATVEQMYQGSVDTVHGQSLLEPVKKERIISGYQGRPFIQPCDMNHAFLANSTHVVWFRPGGYIEMEVSEEGNHAYLKERISKVSEEEMKKWLGELSKYECLVQTWWIY